MRPKINVVFEISDDGPGIAPEVADHLFERFSKGSDGKHGIGLALALAIAEEHNGTVKAYNKPEGGACFEIIIPVLTGVTSCQRSITTVLPED